MRPIRFILGLAFVATVLIINVDSIKGCLTANGCGFKGYECCDTDYCNGAVTSIPPAALLIAVITGVIAAVGI
ncbi:hypothetical protein AAVH_01233 [Aphelenchoides avenae]|nr:hypothetical protein AAVH_01233 [Aphelenchus avenae]